MRRFQWFALENGRQVGRFVDERHIDPARSDLPCPRLSLDTMEPLVSAADGKTYTSKAAMRASYLPSGNPEGVRFEEIGNDPARLKPMQKPKTDRRAIKDAVQRAAAQTRA